jgi:hypothetical protein
VGALVSKAIRLSRHAAQQLSPRGCTEEEVIDAIRTSPWSDAERGRKSCLKDFVYNKEWNGVRYATKQVRPVFTEEAGEIVVVTVYTYYF